MKKHTILALLLMAGSMQAVAQVGYMKDIAVSDHHVVREAGQVAVSMKLDLSRVDMKRQHTIELVPVLVSQDGTREAALPSVVVNGTLRDRAIHRSEVLTGKPYYDNVGAQVRRRNGCEQAIEYRATIDYAKWMLDGRLELREAVTGCAECEEGSERSTLLPVVLERFVPHYATVGVREPKAEVVKRREEVRSARLQFRQNSHTILPEFKDNRAELAGVQQSIDLVKDNKDVTITGIYVTGYASPEGTAAYNMELSKRRAQTFTDYVQRQHADLDKSLWHVNWKGEDWAGLRAEVAKHPHLLKIDEVLAIIDGCEGDVDRCEQRIKDLVPSEIYTRLLNEMYGPLRRNEYRIEYNVRSFDIDEAKGLIHTQPKLVSQHEMYLVAGTYGKGTPEYTEVMLVAAATYPDDATALGNAAVTLIESGKPAEAARLLEKSRASLPADLLNLLATAYAQSGDYERAASTYRQAVSAGDSQARGNLKQLQRVMEEL